MTMTDDYTPPRVEQHDYRTEEVRLVMSPQQAADLRDAIGGFGWDGAHALYDLLDALAEADLPDTNTLPADLEWRDTFSHNRADAAPTRYAVVLVSTTVADGAPERIAAYLPSNYQVTGTGPAPEGDRFRRVHIAGRDRMGWTLDGYVIPRLASGLYGCTEVTAEGEVIA